MHRYIGFIRYSLEGLCYDGPHLTLFTYSRSQSPLSGNAAKAQEGASATTVQRLTFLEYAQANFFDKGTWASNLRWICACVLPCTCSPRRDPMQAHQHTGIHV